VLDASAEGCSPDPQGKVAAGQWLVQQRKKATAHGESARPRYCIAASIAPDRRAVQRCLADLLPPHLHAAMAS